MTILLTSTVVVLGPSAADNNACAGTMLPIKLFHRECHPLQAWKLTQIAAHSSRALAARPKKSTSRRGRQPSTTLADLLTPRLVANPFSAMWTSLRWWSSDEFEDGVAHGWQSRLGRWPIDSFFPPCC